MVAMDKKTTRSETKSDNKTSNTSVAQADTPSEETQAATQETETAIQSEAAAKLDINKLDPSVNASVMDALSKQQSNINNIDRCTNNICANIHGK